MPSVLPNFDKSGNSEKEKGEEDDQDDEGPWNNIKRGNTKQKGHENWNAPRLRKQTLFIQHHIFNAYLGPRVLLSTGDADMVPGLVELRVAEATAHLKGPCCTVGYGTMTVEG